MKGNIFSDDWYKISSLKLSIAYTANIHKQYFRGREWFVIHEPFNNKFFRVTPEAYRFLMALTPKKTVEEVWENYLDLHPLDTPTQDEIIRLLSGLHRADLLYFKNRPKNEYIFDRYTQGEKQKLKEKLLSFLYLKIPLWDPEYWLRKSKPFIEILISKYSFLVWLIVLFFGLKSFVENYSDFSDQAQGVLSASNLVYLYLSMAVLKFFHELGHSMMVKKFGGQVHTLGVMLVVFTPLPYMDASDSWAFRNKWHRILVGSAGMLVELFFASIASMIWANTGDGIVHSIAFNIMIIGSISSIFFNGNPLLKFDSYYMLSDYLEIPNLQKKSRDVWYYFVEKYLFGIKEVLSPIDSIQEGLLLSIYGVLSTFYRFLVAILIGLFVLDKIFAVGVVMFMISIFLWILKPIYEFISYLFTSYKLYKKRDRAYIVTLSALSLIVILVGLIPFDDDIRAPGVIKSDNFINIYVPTEGYLKDILVKNGQKVKKGDVLFVLENKELLLDLKIINSQLDETNALLLKSRLDSIADLKQIQERIEFLKDRKVILSHRIEDLDVKATSDGIWVSEKFIQKKNTWIKLREHVGYIVPVEHFDFVAVVSQEEASYLFKYNNLDGEIKLYGKEDITIDVPMIKVIPFEKNKLPSAYLGWLGGGDIAVSQQDEMGVETLEAFFEVRADIYDAKGVELFINRSGVLKINLPKKTLAKQFIEFISQLTQKRYKL